MPPTGAQASVRCGSCGRRYVSIGYVTARIERDHVGCLCALSMSSRPQPSGAPGDRRQPYYGDVSFISSRVASFIEQMLIEQRDRRTPQAAWSTVL